MRLINSKKADFAWWHLMMLLLAIALILFMLVFSTELGDHIKRLLLSIFDIF